MFYSQFILAKKGPLGTIWIAAHLERKLRKNQVADTDIGVSVDSILFPEVPIALRLSSHLLLGVVRIYSKKVNYLFDDCSEALLKVKQAFRSAAVDLPPEQSKAPYHSITLPETFDLDDFELPDNDIFQGNFVDHHVSTREQITLQDTMDGVAFPTSQFGPDERFGDGDMSQIGLDLEEELLLNKGEAGGTSGNSMDIDEDPQTLGKTSPSKLIGHNEGVFPSVCSPGSCFIQAPSTPGLMEEPNLSTAQDALASDEHIEEDHNLSELTAKEVFGTASSQPEPSHFNDSEFNVTENGVLLDEPVKENTKSPEDEPSSKTLELNDQPPSDEHFVAADGPQSINNEIIITEALSKEHWKTNDVAANEIVVLPEGDASMMEVDNRDDCTISDKPDLNGSLHTSTDSKSETHNIGDGSTIFGSLEPDGLTSNGCSKTQDEGQTCLNSGNTDGLESGMDKRVDVAPVPFLRACTSNVQNTCNGVAASSLQAEEGSHCSVVISGNGEAANFSKVQDEIPEVSYVENSDVDGQPVNITGDQFEMENGTIYSDFSAPEKLLSMPTPPAGRSDNFLDDFTPGKNNYAEDNGDATGEAHISGRKRSFTESTLTMQSMNSTETSGFAQSKGSVEFLPDDDDLLSSILVGRKSMGLKMKPTPPIADSAPSKRQRVSVRSSALKRKVLVDDSMVLHGDTIRQQLTTTEDIRRIRKKAPCTHLEIWMLQKHFLEDEVFNEPVLTGVSPALRCLHNETFHLTGIRIVSDDTSNAGKEAEASPRPTCSVEPQVMDDPSVRDDMEQEHAGNLETLCQHESALGLCDDTMEKNMRVVDNELGIERAEYDVSVGLEHEHGRDIDNGVMEVDAVNPSHNMDGASISAADLVTEINGTATDVPAVEPSYQGVTDEAVASPVNDASYQSLDNTTAEEAYREEKAASAGLRDQDEVDVSVLGKIDSNDRSDVNVLLEKEEGIETAVGIEDMQGNSSLPDPDIGTMDSVCLVDETYQTTAQFTEECQLDQSSVENKDEFPASDMGQDSSNIATNDLQGDDIKLDCLHPERDDLICQIERDDSDRVRADPDNLYDSMGVSANLNDADIRTDAIDHDTDFLNVDDDDVTEDYEGDMPNTEENRLLDNSGWSSRTRMVANYLQVLFEKEPQHAKKQISVGSLLAGKTRKEASRMFFETLVLTTKDYIHAEQEIPFGDIHVVPQGKLLKSEF